MLHLTIFVGLSWRQEAEEHAGGNMSWNTGVDYGRMLARSSIQDEVVALYRQAGLSLKADLATLAAAPRITADPAAVGYMARNISFGGGLTRPMLTIHTTGDPLVPVQVEHAYADAVGRRAPSRAAAPGLRAPRRALHLHHRRDARRTARPGAADHHRAVAGHGPDVLNRPPPTSIRRRRQPTYLPAGAVSRPFNLDH